MNALAALEDRIAACWGLLAEWETNPDPAIRQFAAGELRAVLLEGVDE